MKFKVSVIIETENKEEADQIVANMLSEIEYEKTNYENLEVKEVVKN